jgi:hypothetical protein
VESFSEVIHVTKTDERHCARCGKRLVEDHEQGYPVGTRVVLLMEGGHRGTTWTTSDRPTCPAGRRRERAA